ncbi:MAG: hypothetical protein KF821_09000 [Anaerolineales bacterium]|nr:hypothetical protein [Anaerolineales bacterium]
MADPKVRILIEAVNAAEGVIKAARKELKDMGDEGKANNSTFAALKSTWGQGAIALGAVAAAGAAAKKVFDLGKEGAQLEYQAQKFDRLALSAGTVSDVLLRDLRAATRGMYSDAQLMGAAGDFMALGLAKTHDEAVRLSAVASALNMNMNQLVLTLTNQTTMRFDALGVAVDGFDTKLNALVASGMSANDAFTEAFLQQAEEQIERVGHAADSTLGSFQRLEAQGSTAWERLRVNLARSTAPIADDMADTLEVVNDVERALELLGARRLRGTLFELDSGAFVFQNELLQRANFLVEHGAEKYIAFGEAVEDAGGSFRGQSADMQRWMAMAEQFKDLDPGPAASAGAAAGEAYVAEFSERVKGLSGIGKTLNDIKVGMAGGFELQEQVDFASKLQLTPDEAKQIWDAFYVEAALVEERAGNINMAEAKKRIQEELGMPFGEAAALSQEVLDNLDALKDTAVNADLVVNVKVQGDTWVLDLAGGQFVIGGGQALTKGQRADGDRWAAQAGHATGGYLGERGPLVKLGERGWEYGRYDTRKGAWEIIPHEKSVALERRGYGAQAGMMAGGLLFDTWHPPVPAATPRPRSAAPAVTPAGAGGVTAKANEPTDSGVAVQAAADAAVRAATASAVGVGAAVGGQGQAFAAQVVQEMAQQNLRASEQLNAELREGFGRVVTQLQQLARPGHIKNAMLEVIAEVR